MAKSEPSADSEVTPGQKERTGRDWGKPFNGSHAHGCSQEKDLRGILVSVGNTLICRRVTAGGIAYYERPGRSSHCLVSHGSDKVGDVTITVAIRGYDHTKNHRRGGRGLNMASIVFPPLSPTQSQTTEGIQATGLYLIGARTINLPS